MGRIYHYRKNKCEKLGGKYIRPKHYFRWRTMRYRCADKSNPYYGGRGITVCKEWQDYDTFHDWCERTFEEGKSIDRINNDGPYSPENCKWSTKSEQRLNSRNDTPGRRSVMEKMWEASRIKNARKQG